MRLERPQDKFLELVHRLDRETSGCLIFAKKRGVLLELQSAMQKNKIEKRYTALVKGRWPKGKTIINAPLRKNQLSSGERIVKVDATGKASVTHFEIIKRFDEATLMDVTLETGRTHQIRVHCQFSDAPIAGDQRYGDKLFNDNLKSKGNSRLFLHARYLKFRHPLSGDFVEIQAPLPKDLTALLEKLG
jgi:23S rRNA pseudouridine955/2504/2580 synthase